MRVISGTLGGRHFDAPSSNRVHPMSDKVRGSIFSALGDLTGLRVCDAYSGSCALAIEAVSRGAESAIAIESTHLVAQTIKTNLISLGISEKVKVIANKVDTWLAYSSDTFDVIFADPPYDNLPQIKTLNMLAFKMKKSGILVLSWSGRDKLPQIDTLTQLKSKSFNDAQVGYYRKD